MAALSKGKPARTVPRWNFQERHGDLTPLQVYFPDQRADGGPPCGRIHLGAAQPAGFLAFPAKGARGIARVAYLYAALNEIDNFFRTKM